MSSMIMVRMDPSFSRLVFKKEAAFAGGLLAIRARGRALTLTADAEVAKFANRRAGGRISPRVQGMHGAVRTNVIAHDVLRASTRR
jgi:hypothetical protein